MKDFRSSKTFCILPWVHMATYNNGDLLPCCVAQNNSQLNMNKISVDEAWNSPFYRKLRKTLLKGEPHDSCTGCYKEEKYGYKSHRMFENEVWDRNLKPEIVDQIVESTQNDGSVTSNLFSFDLRLGNTCNLQCVMCRPHDSSKWIALNKKLLENTEIQKPVVDHLNYNSDINLSQYNWSLTSHFMSDFESIAPHLKEVILGGGEPFLNENHEELLKICIKQGSAKNILLRYHTNGTVDFQKYLDIWQHFKTVEIFLSLDGYADKNHYLRFPADWSKIEKNIQSLENTELTNIKSMILSSLHFGSFFNILDLLQWVQQSQFKKLTHGFQGHLHPGIVHHPEFLSIQAYSQKIKSIITERLNNFESQSTRPSQKMAGALEFMNSVDKSHLLPSALSYFKAIDRARNTQFEKTFPELNSLLTGVLVESAIV